MFQKSICNTVTHGNFDSSQLMMLRIKGRIKAFNTLQQKKKKTTKKTKQNKTKTKKKKKNKISKTK